MAGVMKGMLMSFLKEMAFSELQTPQNSTDFWNVKENSTDLWNVETLQARRKLFIALFHVHNGAQLLGPSHSSLQAGSAVWKSKRLRSLLARDIKGLATPLRAETRKGRGIFTLRLTASRAAVSKGNNPPSLTRQRL